MTKSKHHYGCYTNNNKVDTTTFKTTKMNYKHAVINNKNKNNYKVKGSRPSQNFEGSDDEPLRAYNPAIGTMADIQGVAHCGRIPGTFQPEEHKEKTRKMSSHASSPVHAGLYQVKLHPVGSPTKILRCHHRKSKSKAHNGEKTPSTIPVLPQTPSMHHLPLLPPTTSSTDFATWPPRSPMMPMTPQPLPTPNSYKHTSCPPRWTYFMSLGPSTRSSVSKGRSSGALSYPFTPQSIRLPTPTMTTTARHEEEEGQADTRE